MTMKSSQLVNGGYTMALLQGPEWPLNGTTGIRGSLSFHRYHRSISGCKESHQLLKSSVPDSQYRGLLSFTVWHSRRRCSGRVFSSRKDSRNISSLERLVRRTVRSEQEQKQKEDDMKKEQSKPVPSSSNHSKLEVIMVRVQNVQMTAQIFTSMMTWVVLFFLASVWDGDSQSSQNPGKKNGKRGPRR